MVGKFSTDVLNLIELLNVIKAVICAVKNVCSLQVTSTAIIIRMMANGIISASTEEEQREIEMMMIKKNRLQWKRISLCIN